LTSKNTLDTAIAAWKAATTQIDRDLAAQAIGEHIAYDTPEGADYESATDELLARLKAEFGPVPVEDLRGFYIALPAELTANEIEGIWGVGRSEQLAVADAHYWTQTQPATVEQGDNEWIIRHEGSTFRCQTRQGADACAATLGYRAWPCTEALYRRVKEEGYDTNGRNSYGYAKNGSLYDVVERDAA
jgi:hypothetical protein